MKTIRTAEELINEVRTTQKKMRSLYWHLTGIGFISQGDELQRLFTEFDIAMLDAVKVLVETYFSAVQLSLFDQKEDTSMDVSSGGGSSG